MPTSNPRVQVTLSPSLDSLVQRLAAQQRSSKSQVLRELLEAAEPALLRAVTLMEAASRASKEVRIGLARSLNQAQDRVERGLADTLAEMDATTTDLVALAETVRERRPARSSGSPAPAPGGRPPNPPASNRGVKSQRRAGEEGGRKTPIRVVKGGRS